MIGHLLGQTCEILTFAQDSTDAYGNPVDSWPAPGGGTTVACRLEQAATTDDTDDRSLLASTWRLFLLADAPLGGRDLVVTDQGVMHVVGEPHLVHTPAGPHHLEALLELHDD